MSIEKELKSYVDDELTVIRIHMEEFEESLNNLKVIVASLLKGGKLGKG